MRHSVPNACPSPFAHDRASSDRIHSRTASLALAALGIVYGDIGTSPLYTIKECFHGMHAVEVSPTNVMGVLSMVFWSLMVVVSLKYVVFILRADNKGEGGIFALLAMLHPVSEKNGKLGGITLLMAAFGAALLYGDGVITPAISVLSAMEGLEVATPAAKEFVPLMTCLVLLGLFMFQHRGTAAIGRVFGPVMILWFIVIGGLGFMEIVAEPRILSALNPVWALRFFAINHLHGIVVLGSVVLCVTGGEALYADMGHFGRLPIRISWYCVVLPGLLLNYFGQGALLLDHPEMAFTPFYALVPKALLYPMVVLSTTSTIIASQAMISGVYSLTRQAMQLGFTPRMRIVHTSSHAIGQIYLPAINWMLMVACTGLVLAFQESSRLAAAYGIAVTATMAITSVFYFQVLRVNWKWPSWKAVPLLALFLFFDLSFLYANLLKVVDGGWITLTFALLVLVVMVTWRDGRAILARHYSHMRIPVHIFLRDLSEYNPHRIPGTAVFMSISPEGVPNTLLLQFKHNEAMHERIVLLSILSTEHPFVHRSDRVTVEDMGHGFHRVVARYGYMESPDVPQVLELAAEKGLSVDVRSASFFLGRETLLTAGEAPMARWRKILFAFMSRNAWNATSYFNIPPDRVVELGAQVAL